MKIVSLYLANFRKYRKKSIVFHSNMIIISGPNAIGKSTILEAITVLGTTRSFRKCSDKDLTTLGEREYLIKGLFVTNKGENEITISYKNETKSIYKNNNPYKKMSELLNEMKIVTFSPLDSILINGSPLDRRNFFNLFLTQMDLNFARVHNNYSRFLKERNYLLKKALLTGKIDIQMLDVINEQLIKTGKQIINYRCKIIDKLNSMIPKIYDDLADSSEEKISISYIYNTNEKDYESLLANFLQDNIKKGTTTIGPHRDDFIINLNGQSINIIGSQGQQRDALISIKIAITNILYECTKEYPILLLDDVFSELDAFRQNNIIKTLDKNIQTIITSASLTDIKKEILQKSEIIVLE